MPSVISVSRNQQMNLPSSAPPFPSNTCCIPSMTVCFACQRLTKQTAQPEPKPSVMIATMTAQRFTKKQAIAPPS